MLEEVACVRAESEEQAREIVEDLHRSGAIEVNEIAEVEYDLREERAIHFQRATIFGKPVIITDMEPYTLPEMEELKPLNRYEIQASHENHSLAASLVRYVPLDHLGTVYSMEPLMPPDCRSCKVSNEDIVYAQDRESCAPSEYIEEQTAKQAPDKSEDQAQSPVQSEEKRRSVRGRLQEKKTMLSAEEAQKKELYAGAFEYGGYHFIPERSLRHDETDLFTITRKLKTDEELGMFDKGFPKAGKVSYTWKGFCAASPDKKADLFRCVENGKLYLPCEHELAEYKDSTLMARKLDFSR